MQMKEFRVTNYRSINDSGWISVVALTAIVGKNEAGKTSLLRALHKFNPFDPTPYHMNRDWPRERRASRSSDAVVCTVRFALEAEEQASLAAISGGSAKVDSVDVTRDFAGRFEVHFESDIDTQRVHPNEIDASCSKLPEVNSGQVSVAFAATATRARQEAIRLAHEGRFSELESIGTSHHQLLSQSSSAVEDQKQHEQAFLSSYVKQLGLVAQQLKQAKPIHHKLHEYIVGQIPVFIYMGDYRTFSGSAHLDQVLERKQKKQLNGEDQTLLMLLGLAGLSIEDEVKKGTARDREERHYDLDDAGNTLTKLIEDRWSQRKYTVRFRADGHQFFTMVEDSDKRGLIPLEERSKGFQWFFSFDLLFMHESRGTFRGCVLLLDEPGLHLHAQAQRDLLQRLVAYSADNTLIYTTHLPFMLDMRHPERIRVLAEAAGGTVVHEEFSSADSDGKLTLSAALGISAATSYLVANRNLVVEGVDDFWIVTELSNLLIRAGEEGLPDDVLITAAGGAPEAAYMATFMIGQNLGVVTLLDSDDSGEEAADRLIKKWLTKYKDSRGEVVMLADAIGARSAVAIEDLFTSEYYLERVSQAYQRELKSTEGELNLDGGGLLVKQVERAFKSLGIQWNKGRVAKLLRHDLARLSGINALPPVTVERARSLLKALNFALKKV